MDYGDTCAGIGIRVCENNLFYLANLDSSWEGAGWMTKLIGDCYRQSGNSAGLVSIRAGSRGLWLLLSGEFLWLGARQSQRRIISKPKEYAVVLGLFALGFVFFHCHRMMERKRQRATAL